MISGLAALDESGIVPHHRTCFQQLADRQDLYIMVRNVNKLCTSLIEHDYPTKGMSVHGKSSDWGPQAGLICVNQELSKYQGKDRVPKLNAEVEHSLGAHGKGDVEATQMQLPMWRLTELQQLGLVAVSKSSWAQVGHMRHAKVLKLTCPGRPHTFTARATDASADLFDITVHLSGRAEEEPVMVIRRKASLTGRSMTQTERTLPLTADYDLFSVCPNFKVLDLGREDRFSNARADLPEIGHHAANQGMHGRYKAPAARNMGNAAKMMGSFQTAAGGQVRVETDYSAGQAHKVLGHTSMRQEFVRSQLNALINATYKGGDTVHHGAEVMNPFPEADDFGITAFVPNGTPTGLQTITDLNQFYEAVRQKGYYMHINPLWGWKPMKNPGQNVMNVATATWRG